MDRLPKSYLDGLNPQTDYVLWEDIHFFYKDAQALQISKFENIQPSNKIPNIQKGEGNYPIICVNINL